MRGSFSTLKMSTFAYVYAVLDGTFLKCPTLRQSMSKGGRTPQPESTSPIVGPNCATTNATAPLGKAVSFRGT